MNMPPPAAFGTLLRRHRKAAGLTQEELAARAGMSAHGIADLEASRRRTPRRETVALLADALSLPDQVRQAFEAAARQQPLPAPAPVAAIQPSGSASSPVPGGHLVGRVAEVARIVQHLGASGPPLLIFAGEPGIGKSRLLREAALLARAQAWEVLGGGCHRRSGQEPFSPLLTALERHLAQQAPTQQRRHLQGCGRLACLLPELVDSGVILDPGAPLPPEQERRLMFAAVGRYLANVAGAAGTLLLLDDLQWAATDALDLLAALLRAPPAAPLRVVAAYRDTEIRKRDPLAILLADLSREDLAARVVLEALSLTEARVLLEELLPAATEADHPTTEREQLKEQLLLRAGGMPYFLLSCAQAITSGALVGPEVAVSIPWGVAETIRQRIHALGDDAQSVLDVAAIIGREVPRRMLMAVGERVGIAEATTFASLDAACQARLLTEQGAHAYAFAHDLVREVVGGDLTAARRTHLHRTVAEVMELAEDHAPAELLAYHFARGGELQKAVPYALRAAERAAHVYAHAEAIHRYQEAAEMLGTLGRETELAQVHEHLALMHFRSAQYDEAIAFLNQAIDVYQRQGDDAGVVRAMAPLGLAYARRGSITEGVARLEPVTASIREHDAARGAAALYIALATLYKSLDREQDALTMAEQAQELARAAGDVPNRVSAQAQRGAVLIALDRVSEGLRVLEDEVVPLAETSGEIDTLARVFEEISLVYHAWGQLDRRQDYLERALPLAERLGDPSFTIRVLYQLGENEVITGEWRHARGHLERAVSLSRGIQTSHSVAYPLFGLGGLLVYLGEENGLRYLEEALAVAERTENRDMARTIRTVLAEHSLVEGRPRAAYAWLADAVAESAAGFSTTFFAFPVFAWALLETGEVSRAEALLARTIARARDQKLLMILADALRIQALLYIEQEQWQHAEQALEEGLALCERIPFRKVEAELLYTYGLYHRARGETQQARQRLTEALAMFARMGERLYARQAERALDEVKAAR